MAIIILFIIILVINNDHLKPYSLNNNYYHVTYSLQTDQTLNTTSYTIQYT